MAKPKRNKPGARLFVSADKSHADRLERIALKAGKEGGRAIPSTEAHRRGMPALLACLESCASCRAGTCDGLVHVRPSAPKNLEVSLTSNDRSRSSFEFSDVPTPPQVPPVAVVTIAKTMAVDDAGQGALFGSTPAFVAADVAAAPKRKRSTSTARAYPEGFVLTDEMRAYAVKNGIAADRVDDMFEHFSTHHRAKGSKFVDWTLAFYTWVRNDRQFRGTNQKRAGEPSAIQGGGKDGIPW